MTKSLKELVMKEVKLYTDSTINAQWYRVPKEVLDPIIEALEKAERHFEWIAESHKGIASGASTPKTGDKCQKKAIEALAEIAKLKAEMGKGGES